MSYLVSVIVPVYNVEAYLERCLSSLVNQSYNELQIILVDDGSTDRSPMMCDEWAVQDQRILVIHKENAGAGIARNTGLEYASGKYIMFVDSDDYLDTTTIEKCISDAILNNSQIVMFGRCFAFSDGSIKKKTLNCDKLIFENDDIVNDILPGLFTYSRGIGISVWGKFFSADVIKNSHLKFPSEREYLSEDAIFILEAFQNISKASIVPENLYFHYHNESSLSKSYKSDHQLLNDAFLTYGLELCQRYNYPSDVTSRLKARYLMYALSGMKRIIRSSLDNRLKRKEFKSLFNNKNLHNVITDDVIGLLNKPSRLFWRLYKLRCYHMCYFLAWYKAAR